MSQWISLQNEGGSFTFLVLTLFVNSFQIRFLRSDFEFISKVFNFRVKDFEVKNNLFEATKAPTTK